MKQRTLMFAAAAAALIGGATAASGGYVSESYAYCQKRADGSGSCAGTFLGFRNLADPQARASFYFNHAGQSVFQAHFNGQWHNCLLPANANAHQLASSVKANHWFTVEWDASATCTYVTALAGSPY